MQNPIPKKINLLAQMFVNYVLLDGLSDNFERFLKEGAHTINFLTFWFAGRLS